MGYKWTLNGVAFSCSSARVNHNELRIMFGFLVPSYIPDTSIKLHSVTSQLGKHVTAVRSSDLNHKQWHLLTCSQTHWQSNYSCIQQLDTWFYNLISIRLAKISKTCWVSYKMRSEVLKVVKMMLPVTLCSLTGKESPPSAWPTLTTHHHTPADCNHAIPTILPVLFNDCFILIWVPLCLPAKL